MRAALRVTLRNHDAFLGHATQRPVPAGVRDVAGVRAVQRSGSQYSGRALAVGAWSTRRRPYGALTIKCETHIFCSCTPSAGPTQTCLMISRLTAVKDAFGVPLAALETVERSNDPSVRARRPRLCTRCGAATCCAPCRMRRRQKRARSPLNATVPKLMNSCQALVGRRRIRAVASQAARGVRF